MNYEPTGNFDQTTEDFGHSGSNEKNPDQEAIAQVQTEAVTIQARINELNEQILELRLTPRLTKDDMAKMSNLQREEHELSNRLEFIVDQFNKQHA